MDGTEQRPPIVLVEPVGAQEWEHVLLSVMADEARRRGWQLLDTAYVRWDAFAELGVCGALVQSLPGSALVERLRRACPVVRVGLYAHPDDASLPAVLPDIEAQGRLAAELFSRRGYRHVGYVGYDPWTMCRPMYERFRRESEKSGMTCHLVRLSAHRENMVGHSSVQQRQSQFIAWLAELPKPCGLLMRGDRGAAEAAFLAQQAGYRVPEELSILGRGNITGVCESALPAISSLDQDDRGKARLACDLLSRIVAGESLPSAPLLVPPVGVVERSSTNALGVADPLVAKAAQYIWDNIQLDLSVDDVARASEVPRHRLERAFRKHLGRGVNAELVRRRLDVLRHRLCSTDDTIAELSAGVGFRNLSHLHRMFRRTYGMSPRQYRQRHERVPRNPGM